MDFLKYGASIPGAGSGILFSLFDSLTAQSRGLPEMHAATDADADADCAPAGDSICTVSVFRDISPISTSTAGTSPTRMYSSGCSTATAGTSSGAPSEFGMPPAPDPPNTPLSPPLDHLPLPSTMPQSECAQWEREALVFAHVLNRTFPAANHPLRRAKILPIEISIDNVPAASDPGTISIQRQPSTTMVHRLVTALQDGDTFIYLANQIHPGCVPILPGMSRNSRASQASMTMPPYTAAALDPNHSSYVYSQQQTRNSMISMAVSPSFSSMSDTTTTATSYEDPLDEPEFGYHRTHFKLSVASHLESLLQLLSGPQFKLIPTNGPFTVTAIMRGETVVVLELLWRLLRASELTQVRLDVHPQLLWLLQDGEPLPAFLLLHEDQLLLRWVNYHLSKAGSRR